MGQEIKWERRRGKGGTVDNSRSLHGLPAALTTTSMEGKGELFAV